MDDVTVLSRTAASGPVEAIGWRYLLGTLVTSVTVGSLAEANRVAALAVNACGTDPDAHLRLDLRPDRVELSLQTRAVGGVCQRDLELAQSISSSVSDVGATTGGATTAELARPVQLLELCVDAVDIAAVRPFWQAVLGLGDSVGGGGPTDDLVDPLGQLPSVWFQQMDAPREQRNRIHLDITVAHDEAEARVAAALAAGGVLVSDSEARAFWILADVEGNEVCVCTWTDRDERGWNG